MTKLVFVDVWIVSFCAEMCWLICYPLDALTHDGNFLKWTVDRGTQTNDKQEQMLLGQSFVKQIASTSPTASNTRLL